MREQQPKKVKKVLRKTPKKPAEKELYWLWYSLSPILKLRSPGELDTLGIVDPEVRELLGVRTQGEFEKKFNVSNKTVAKWNLEFDKRPAKERFFWVRKLTSNAIAALYRKLLAEGDAGRFKIWMQVFEDWQEKTQVSNPAETEAMREHTKVLRELANRK